MALSEYFSDEDLVSQLRLQFDEEEQFDVDFRVFFNHIIDRGGDFYLEFRNRKFSIDKMSGSVTEIKEKNEEEDNGDE